MTPSQRTQVADLKRRGAYGDAGKRMVAEMERIDQQAPLRQVRSPSPFTRQRAVWWGELIGACFVIAIFIAVAFFVGTNQ